MKATSYLKIISACSPCSLLRAALTQTGFPIAFEHPAGQASPNSFKVSGLCNPSFSFSFFFFCKVPFLCLENTTGSHLSALQRDGAPSSCSHCCFCIINGECSKSFKPLQPHYSECLNRKEKMDFTFGVGQMQHENLIPTDSCWS